jgi:hypothetical protein
MNWERIAKAPRGGMLWRAYDFGQAKWAVRIDDGHEPYSHNTFCSRKAALEAWRAACATMRQHAVEDAPKA